MDIYDVCIMRDLRQFLALRSRVEASAFPWPWASTSVCLESSRPMHYPRSWKCVRYHACHAAVCRTLVSAELCPVLMVVADQSGSVAVFWAWTPQVLFLSYPELSLGTSPACPPGSLWFYASQISRSGRHVPQLHCCKDGKESTCLMPFARQNCSNSSLVKQLPLSATMVWGSPVKENVCRSLVSVTLVVANDTMLASFNLLCASTIINSMQPSIGLA